MKKPEKKPDRFERMVNKHIHNREQKDEIARLREALKEMVKAYNQLLPGISKIAVQDYANINEAPILAKQALKETP